MTLQYLYLTSGERVDLSDLQYAALDSQLGTLQALPQAVLTAPTKQQAWIVQGFALSNPTGQVLTVAAGSAILAMRQGAQVTPGTVFATQDSVSVDLTSYSAATYNVYVRFVFAPTNMDTRTFWQAGGTGQEYAATVPTRSTGEVEVAVGQTLPGAEYLQIGTVTVPSMALVDMRPLYFEGRIDQATAANWGSADDRSADRAAHGIGDLQTALSAIRQCLEEIKGAGIARWYSPFVAGQTIGYAGQAVLGQTSWGDANFYAQGDSNRPRLTFGADGAHLAYNRPTSTLAATGAALAAAAGSLSTAFAFRSGTDEVLIRAQFYRFNASQGGRGIDALLARGTAGGLGFYDDQGRMASAGVGLGFGLATLSPTLFVNNFAAVFGASSGANIVQDSNQVLQVPVLNGNIRYLTFTDGSSSLMAFGLGNNFMGSGGAFGYLSFNGANWLVGQGGYTVASLSNSVWQFGPNSGSTALRNVRDGGVNIVNSSVQPGVATPVLWLNNNNSLPGVFNPYDCQVAMGTGATVYFRQFAGAGGYSLLDAANGVNIFSYNTTTKGTVFPNTVAMGQINATGGTTTAYAFSPAVTHTTTYSGLLGVIRYGNQGQGMLLGYLGASSVGNTVNFVLPIQAMQGQQALNWNVQVAGYASNNSNSINVSATYYRTDMQNQTDNQVGVTRSGTITSSNAILSLGGPINSETSNPFQCWSIYISMTSNGSFNADLRFATVTFSTPALNPQRQ